MNEQLKHNWISQCKAGIQDTDDEIIFSYDEEIHGHHRFDLLDEWRRNQQLNASKKNDLGMTGGGTNKQVKYD